jgi:hypothetical protein
VAVAPHPDDPSAVRLRIQRFVPVVDG